MKLMTCAEAAEAKGVSRQAIYKALERKDLRIWPVTGQTMVMVDSLFEDWVPMFGPGSEG